MNSSRTVVQAFFQPCQKIFNFYQAGIRYFFKYPLTSLTLALSMETLLVNGEKPCTAVMPVFNYPTTGYLEEYYSDAFDIYANVKNLADAEYILIGIVSNNVFQYESQNQLINYLGNVSDHIFFSGAADFFDCQTYCLTPSINPNVTDDASVCLSLTTLESKFICKGWETSEFALIQHNNKILFDEYKAAELKFLKLKTYNEKYAAFKTNLTSFQADVTAQGMAVYYQIIGAAYWKAQAFQFLEVIDCIFRDCIVEDYAAVQFQINVIKLILRNASSNAREQQENPAVILQAFNNISKQTEEAMLKHTLEFGVLIKNYQDNYNKHLTSAMRVEQGLVPHLEASKGLSGKKFFISPFYQYLNKSTVGTFFNCNMSRLLDNVYKSVQDRPFAALIFKPN